MKKEIKEDALLTEAKKVKNFVIANDYKKSKLIKLAQDLKSKKELKTKIYWLDGADKINYPSFKSIMMGPRFIVKNDDIVKDSEGLIFPQTEPIILIIANFSKLNKDDQEKYIERICKSEEGDYLPCTYLHDESIVIIGKLKNEKIPDISYKLQERKIV